LNIFKTYTDLLEFVDQNDCAIVSEDTPLLVELSAQENLSLILKYHEKISVKKADILIKELLKDMGLGKLRDKKPFELNKLEKVSIQLIRAYISPFEKICIIKPFSMLNRVEDLSYIITLSEKFDKKEVSVLDTHLHNFYKESRCLTIR